MKWQKDLVKKNLRVRPSSEEEKIVTNAKKTLRKDFG